MGNESLVTSRILKGWFSECRAQTRTQAAHRVCRGLTVCLHLGSKPCLLVPAVPVRTALLEEKHGFSKRKSCGRESSSDRSLDRSASFNVSVHSLSVYNLNVYVIWDFWKQIPHFFLNSKFFSLNCTHLWHKIYDRKFEMHVTNLVTELCNCVEVLSLPCWLLFELSLKNRVHYPFALMCIIVFIVLVLLLILIWDVFRQNNRFNVLYPEE